MTVCLTHEKKKEINRFLTEIQTEIRRLFLILSRFPRGFANFIYIYILFSNRIMNIRETHTHREEKRRVTEKVIHILFSKHIDYELCMARNERFKTLTYSNIAILI